MKLRIVILLIGSVLSIVFGQKQCENQRKCVPFSECPEYRMYDGTPYKAWPLAVRREVKEFYCSTPQERNTKVVKVCCKGKQGRDLLDLKNCGKQTKGRIAHGKIAQVFEFPWMALLGDINGDFHCGGSLIAESFVLTAVHCNRKKVDFVRIGETDLSTPRDCNYAEGEEDCADPYQDIPVAQFIRHPKYSSSKKKNDIALIKLRHSAQLNDNARPICLPLPEMLDKKVHPKMIVSGWGFTEDSNAISNKLRYANVPIVEQGQCQRSLNRLSNVYTVDESQICAGDDSGLADNCEGDSGGPLQYPGKGAFVIHGIVSWGLSTCGKEKAPGVYTRVSHYVDWILDNLK